MQSTGTRRLVVAIAAAVVLAVIAPPAQAGWQEGVAAFKAKDYATAAKEFEGVTQTNPDFAGGYYMLGSVQLQLDRTSQALTSLRKAVELENGNAVYRLALGQALVQAKQYGDAYATLKQVSASSLPASQRSVYTLLFAKAATEGNHLSEAVQAVRTQLAADSKNGRLYQALGVAYDAQGEEDKAYDAFKMAYDLEPSNDSAGRSAVYAAINAARQARSTQAKSQFYSHAGGVADRLASSKGTFEHYLLAGEAWLGAQQFVKATPWFQKALSKQPQNALVHFYLGQCYSSRSKFDDALSELQQALKIGAQGKLRRQVYNQLGYVYAKQKDFDKAIAAYRQADNQAKVAETQKAQDAAAHNVEAQKEQKEYEQKMEELQEKMKQLEQLGGGGGGR